MAVAEAWEVIKRAIEDYTGLSPATFFTVLAVAAALYHAVTGFLAPPPPPPPRKREAEPIPPPVQVGEITEEELRAYDGSDPEKPLLMAIKGQIYDVTRGRMFYGPGGPYALFAGRDASRALAKMSFEPQDLTGDISGLGPSELDALQDWEYQFMSKYEKVGTTKKTVPVAEESGGSASEITERSAQAAETGATAEHAVDSKDGALGHGDEGKQQAEVKEIGSSGHSVEADRSGESKEVGADDGAIE